MLGPVEQGDTVLGAACHHVAQEMVAACLNQRDPKRIVYDLIAQEEVVFAPLEHNTDKHVLLDHISQESVPLRDAPPHAYCVILELVSEHKVRVCVFQC